MCIYDAAVEFNVVEMRRIFCIKLKRSKRFYQLTVFNQNIIKRDGHLTFLFHLHFFLVCFLSPRQISVIGYSFSLWPRKVTRIEPWCDQKVSNNTAYPWFIVTTSWSYHQYIRTVLNICGHHLWDFVNKKLHKN